LSGILLGVDAGLPVVVQEDFRATGTTHIIAISGQILTQPRLLLSWASFPLLLLFGREAPAGVLYVT
jgi:predicted membrane metal-binding protein